VAESRRGRQHARSASRRLALQALYQWQITHEPWQDLQRQYLATEEAARVDVEAFRALLSGVCGASEALDAELARFSGIPVAQLDPVEHAITWIGLFELLHAPDVPYRVVINEGIELAKKFGATDGHKFVNAVLDRASIAHRGAERGAVA
jgi:transcription antitermination protein NusB